MEIVSFHGWTRNARLVCQDVELIVTLDVGPRILGYRFIGGPNELFINGYANGKPANGEFKSYGGHRLWIAPEESPRTFQPDNDPVDYTAEGDWHIFTAQADAFHIQKQIRIRADDQQGCFRLVHRIYNHSGYDVELAPWTPTQMAAGGECIFPQAPFIAHAEKVLPARPLVLWHYTKMNDPRWTWGERVVRLKQANAGSTKAGALVQQGYAAYCNHGNTHLRRFAYEEGANYPDYGCNFETYTRADMLEVETLGPMRTVPKKGGYVEHLETWYLVRGESAPDGDEACAEWLENLASARPI